jgi:SlyX protein
MLAAPSEWPMTDDRLLNIETTIAWQDDLLNALNRTVADQAMRIDVLEKQLKLAAEQLQQIAELLLSMNIIDEKPPHY